MSTEHHDQHSDDPSPGSDGGLGMPQTGDEAREHPHDKPARTPRLRIAAVAAAVLLAGGGASWAVAANAGHHKSPTAHGSGMPLRLDGPGLPADVSGGGPDGGGPYRLTGTLPSGPSSAAVQVPHGGVGQAAVQRLAQLLGLSGPVTSAQNAWQVGGSPGGGSPALYVSKDAPGTWSYTRSGPPAVAQPDGATSSTSRIVTGRAQTDGGGTSSPVSPQQAEHAVAPVLSGLGLSHAALDASVTVGPLRSVVADPVVAGLPTHGWATSFEVGADGRIDQGYGRLSPLAKGSTYPVVGAASALKELNRTTVAHPYGGGATSCRMPPTMRPLTPGTDPRSGNTGSGSAAPGNTGSGNTGSATATKTVPCMPRNPHPVMVRGAQFGLSMQYVSGAQELVPSWLFRTQSAGVQGTSVVAQPAVDPKYIASGPPAGPTPVPPSGPVNPGGPIQPGPVQPVDPRAPHPVSPTGYRVQGDTLTLVFWGGACGSYHATADETSTQVRVLIQHTPAPPNHVCPMIERQQTVDVTLKAPLGHRTVVDAADNQPIKTS